MADGMRVATMLGFEQMLTYDMLIIFVPAILMALYCTRNMDTHSVRGMWEWTKAYTGYFCVFAVVFAFFIGIVRRMRG